MHLVVDLQDSQVRDENDPDRALTISLALALARSSGSDVVSLALNACFPNSVEAIRAAFEGVVPQSRIHVYTLPGAAGNRWDRAAAEKLREAHLGALRPDAVLLSSLPDASSERATTSIGNFLPLFSAVLLRPGDSIPAHLDNADVIFVPPGGADRLPPLHGAEVTEIAFPDQCDDGAWNRCAAVLWKVLARCLSRSKMKPRAPIVPATRPRLAYVSPLPPERSGIARYGAELLPGLKNYYEIDVIVNQARVTDPWIVRNCAIRTHRWFDDNAGVFDRVLYQFGNSPFHEHMFELLERNPGVVTLHDFFLGDARREWRQAEWVRELYRSHGYLPLIDRIARGDLPLLATYPCNFSIFRHAHGVVVHSELARTLAHRWYGEGIAEGIAAIPLLRAPADRPERSAAKSALGFGADDFLVCSFGMIGATKQNLRLIEAWNRSGFVADPRCHLVFVGEMPGGEYAKEMVLAVAKAKRVRVTGWVSDEEFGRYLAAADLAVQLRTASRGETSATILDCMNYGIATIANRHGSANELPADAIRLLDEDCTDDQLIRAMEDLRGSESVRRALGDAARDWIRREHNPLRCAESCASAIENFYLEAGQNRWGLYKQIAEIPDPPVGERKWRELAEAISVSLPAKRPARQLLVDVSAVVETDLRSGIQRVVRAITRELLQNAPAGFRVEPVCFSETGYRYARGFTLDRMLRCSRADLEDSLIETYPGDLFLALDYHAIAAVRSSEQLALMRRRGVGVYFVVYDLLPALRPDAFPEGASDMHTRWLSVVCQSDGAMCISRSVADELKEWMKIAGVQRMRPFKLGWFHLGADMQNSVPTTGLPEDAPDVLRELECRPSFIAVGTLEPRKGYRQLLDAFEQLWNEGFDANLLIVGRNGWMVDDVVRRLSRHSQRDSRLFWLNNVSDEYLELLYKRSQCLIAASEAEGFGLPLIEAARHALPILARDIPVFREVAGEHAVYFSGTRPSDLAEAVKRWWMLRQSGKLPAPDLPILTWSQSAKALLEGLISGETEYCLSQNGVGLVDNPSNRRSSIRYQR